MRQIVLSLILISFLSACGGPEVYKDVFNKDGGPNVKAFSASVDNCYLATKRAVLSQNFRVEKEDLQAKSLTAARYFEDGKDSTVLTVNANVIAAGSDKATIYINAVQHVEKIRTKTQSTFFGLIPIGSEATKTMQEERTVEDVDFYKKFFEAVEKEIKILAVKN
ncbi:MAG: DUF2242 domain-containing protein [Nitrospirae bacterium]|nr:DUF2242 domain-containing protein [Nitrospirota bacterium]